ncbi:MAG: hypothetical protein HC897_14465 [Thermoanaerobaculia bacterium]|nr:hypothetical protein [Thermoanaerobaculia bacterium]
MLRDDDPPNLPELVVGEPFLVSDGASAVDVEPTVAINRRGEILVGWKSQLGERESTVWTRRFDASGRALGGASDLGEAALASTACREWGCLPNRHTALSAVATREGDFAAVWLTEIPGESYRQTHLALWSLLRSGDERWGAASDFSIGVAEERKRTFSRLVNTPAGNFVAAMSHGNGHVEVSHLDAAGQRLFPTGRFPFSIPTAVTSERPGLAVDQHGNVLLAWTNLWDGDGSGISARTWNEPFAALGLEWRINQRFETGIQVFPSAAATAGDEIIVVWESWNNAPDHRNILQARLRPGGTLLSTPLAQVNATTLGDQRWAQVAANAEGRALVVWELQADCPGYGCRPTEIRAQLLGRSGEPIGDELRFPHPLGGGQRYPAVAVDPAGDFVVAWAEETPDRSLSSIYAQRLGERLPCEPSASTLCLQDQRFEVKIDWYDPREIESGRARATQLTDEAGVFSFFDRGLAEVALKVVDGRASNDHFWVFFAGLSDFAYTLTVSDTAQALTRFYDNPPFVLASRGDTEAFPGRVSAPSPRSEPSRLRSEQKVAAAPLLLGRFRVDVTWKDFEGRTGMGQVVALSEETLYAWFSTPGNVELLLKMLDGRAENGHFWLYYGALSNLEYTINLTDTFTGAVHSYHNPAGGSPAAGIRWLSRADTLGGRISPCSEKPCF